MPAPSFLANFGPEGRCKIDRLPFILFMLCFVPAEQSVSAERTQLAAYGGRDLQSTKLLKRNVGIGQPPNLLRQFRQSKSVINRVAGSMRFVIDRCYNWRWHRNGHDREGSLGTVVAANLLFRFQTRHSSPLGEEKLFWQNAIKNRNEDSFGRSLVPSMQLASAIGELYFPLGGQAYRVSSSFSMSRKHPILGILRPHNGTDFAAPSGCAVYAAHSGVLTLEGAALTLRGRLHGLAIRTVYRHVKMEQATRVGAVVEAGQIIARINGKERQTTGPHLHFEVFIKRPRFKGSSTVSGSSDVGSGNSGWSLINPATLSFRFE